MLVSYKKSPTHERDVKGNSKDRTLTARPWKAEISIGHGLFSGASCYFAGRVCLSKYGHQPAGGTPSCKNDILLKPDNSHPKILNQTCKNLTLKTPNGLWIHGVWVITTWLFCGDSTFITLNPLQKMEKSPQKLVENPLKAPTQVDLTRLLFCLFTRLRIPGKGDRNNEKKHVFFVGFKPQITGFFDGRNNKNSSTLLKFPLI